MRLSRASLVRSLPVCCWAKPSSSRNVSRYAAIVCGLAPFSLINRSEKNAYGDISIGVSIRTPRLCEPGCEVLEIWRKLVEVVRIVNAHPRPSRNANSESGGR